MGERNKQESHVGIKFCQECNNMLYPKEDSVNKRLMYVSILKATIAIAPTLATLATVAIATAAIVTVAVVTVVDVRCPFLT